MSNYARAPTSAPDQPAIAAARPPARTPGNGRLIAWLVLVAVLAGISFTANAYAPHVEGSPRQSIFVGPNQPSGGVYLQPETQLSPTGGFGTVATPRDDTFYRFSTGIGGLVQYGIILGLVLLIARGLPRRETFALYRPRSWARTFGLILGVLVATYVLLALLTTAIGSGSHPDQHIPVFWDDSRAAQFALSFLVVAVAAPIVEELTFRGLGFSLLSRFGPGTALVGTAVLFGLVHGFAVALPVFILVGLALGWLRKRTGSIYPGMVMHGAFNGAALILAVSVGQ